MIYTYNDTKKKGWEIEEVNPEKPTLKVIKCLGEKVIALREDSEEFPREIHDKLQVSTRIKNIYPKNTYIGFSRSGFTPRIYSSDRKVASSRITFICIQVDISAGEQLINYNVYKTGFSIYKYEKDEENKCLRFVVGAKAELLNAAFTLYFRSFDDKIIIKKSWVLDKTRDKLNYYEHYAFIAKNPPKGDKGHINTTDYRINGELPIRVYVPKMFSGNIIIPTTEETDVEAVKKQIVELARIPEGKEDLYTFHGIPSEADEDFEISMGINNIRKYYKTNVCTIYDTQNDITKVEGKEKGYLMELCCIPSGKNIDAWKEGLKAFKHVTIMLKDGKILIYK